MEEVDTVDGVKEVPMDQQDMGGTKEEKPARNGLEKVAICMLILHFHHIIERVRNGFDILSDIAFFEIRN